MIVLLNYRSITHSPLFPKVWWPRAEFKEIYDIAIIKTSLHEIWLRLHIVIEVPVQFSSVQLLSRVQLFATPWIAARQASLSITNSQSSLRLTSIESVMPSSHLILCCPLLLLPPIPPSIKVFSNESTLCMRWPKYWSFSFNIIPSKEIPGLISVFAILQYNNKNSNREWSRFL